MLVKVGPALCVASLAAAGCGGHHQPRVTTSAAQRQDLAVVGIEARVGDGASRGSGIVIDGDRGLIVTAAHTVWGAKTLKIATALGILHGRIVARAPCEDLAVLEIDPRIPGLATLPLAPGAGPARGALLRSVGRRRTAANGVLASIPVRAMGPAGPVQTLAALPQAVAIRLDSPLVPDVTGGPVLDAAGRLVGMAQTGGVAIPWAHVRERLSELRAGPRSVYVGWAGQYRCVGRQHAYARAQHPGFRALDARLEAPLAATRIPGTQGLDG